MYFQLLVLDIPGEKATPAHKNRAMYFFFFFFIKFSYSS